MPRLEPLDTHGSLIASGVVYPSPPTDCDAFKGDKKYDKDDDNDEDYTEDSRSGDVAVIVFEESLVEGVEVFVGKMEGWHGEMGVIFR